MRESLLTIPISEVFEPKCGCPICRMYNTLEDRCGEYIMGAAMMESDIRMETNRLGFCKDHFDLLLKQRNRLSLALMLDTHLNEIKKNIFNKKGLFEAKDAKIKKIAELEDSCYVCSKISWGMERMLVTVVTLFFEEKNFRTLFNEQELLCMPHYRMLCETALQKLSKKDAPIFIKAATQLIENYLDTLNSDVHHYCSMYDYRNSGPDADWGNSKDSIERAIGFLTAQVIDD